MLSASPFRPLNGVSPVGRAPLRPRPQPRLNLAWLAAGLGLLLAHGAHLTGDANKGYGLGASQGLRASVPFQGARAHITFLNLKKLWTQWSGVCHLLTALASHGAYVLPVTSSKLRVFSHAVGWQSWQGSAVHWRAFSLAPLSQDPHQSLQKTPVCLVFLGAIPKHAMSKAWFRLPSVGVDLLNSTATGWAGITVAASDAPLQYFLLSWVWRFCSKRVVM